MLSSWLYDNRLLDALGWTATGLDIGHSYFLTRWIFLRGLGLVCLTAFISFWTQASGLIGSQGILPFHSYLHAVKTFAGSGCYWRLPTVFWLNDSDAALHMVCGLGVFFSLLLTIGVVPILDLVVIWALYLSLVQVGQTFMCFQWDVLLLETCFLAVLLAPPGFLPKLAAERAVPTIALLLLWWLLFRLMFESGIVKLTCGDLTWRNLTALNYHYLTQPLPTPGAWFAQSLPPWFQSLSVVVLYGIEILLPFLIFTPFRPVACVGIVFLMLLILLTGNYNFFNLLTIVLALLLLDDRVWLRLLPESLLKGLSYSPVGHPAIPSAWAAVIIATAVLYFVVGGAQALHACFPQNHALGDVNRRWNILQSVGSLNSYGLFRVMTTRRLEIVVEGSADGVKWVEYAFKYKPGDPGGRPAIVAPHQPRLDWQMWFAALGDYRNTPWFHEFLLRLLEGKPAVLGLLAGNPFPDRPPRYIRALLYDYRFTTAAERKACGAWWKRDFLGSYSPTLGLRPDKR